MPPGISQKGDGHMKKINRTYVMGVFTLIVAALIGYGTSKVPEMLVSNEPGPRLFPYISAIGLAVFAVLSMIFDGPGEDNKPYLDHAGYIRLIVIMAECLAFAVFMNLIGFWITGVAGLFAFIWTLKGDKKINVAVCLIFCIVLSSICYFGFTRGFNIPLPKGSIWESVGISMI